MVLEPTSFRAYRFGVIAKVYRKIIKNEHDSGRIIDEIKSKKFEDNVIVRTKFAVPLHVIEEAVEDYLKDYPGADLFLIMDGLIAADDSEASKKYLKFGNDGNTYMTRLGYSELGRELEGL